MQLDENKINLLFGSISTAIENNNEDFVNSLTIISLEKDYNLGIIREEEFNEKMEQIIRNNQHIESQNEAYTNIMKLIKILTASQV
jgi:hypothetical protein